MLQDIPLWIILPWLFAFGAVVGSFANVCIYRLPRRDRFLDQLKGLSWPPSGCTSCGKRILLKDNIPIYGWLRLLGKCRFCKSRISPRYPIIELLNGLMFVALYLFEIPDHIRYELSGSVLYSANGPQTVNVIAGNNWLYLRYFYHLVLFESLLIATFIDFDQMIIPDGATLPAMFVGFTVAFAVGQVHIVPVWFQNTLQLQIFETWLPEIFHPLISGPNWPKEWIAAHPHLHGLAVSFCGFVAGGGIVWGVRLIGYWVLRREAMGFGDVVLMATIGSFIGWQPVIVVFFLAPVCALVVVILSFFFRRGSEIPFGPYLSLATLILVFGWNRIWPKAEQIFELGIIVPLLIVIVGVLLAVCLMFLQLIKKMLGIELYETEEYAAWTSADQLLHFSGEKVEKDQGNWKKNAWPGVASGRGSFYIERWKNNGY